MFSGSRCCLRTKLNTRILVNDTLLNQPLLFLYLRWLAPNSRHNHTNHQLHETVKGDLALRHPALKPHKRAQAHIVEPSEPRDAPQQSPQNSSQASDIASRSSLLESEIAAEQKLQTILDRRKARQGLVIRERSHDGLYRRIYLPGAGATSIEDGQGKRKRKQRLGYQENSSWKRALNLLAKPVSQRTKPGGEDIWLSEETLIRLSGTWRANSWVHHTRGGCEVEVTDAQSSTGTSRQVFLNGSDGAVALTKEYFLSLEQAMMQQKSNQHENSPLPEAKAGGDDHKSLSISDTHPFIRNVLAKGPCHRKYNCWKRVDKMPEPMEWDVASFLRHVQDLTTKTPPRLVRREIYGQGDRHNVVVANTLCHLFTDTETAIFASTAALNLAFAFLCKHSELFHQTTQLYEQARHLRLTFESQTYSYILHAMLLQDEMISFQQILDDMHSEGHSPDAKVWLTLLNSASSLRQKGITANWMRRKELLGSPSVKGQVAAEVIKAKLEATQEGAVQADQLIGSIDAHFGMDWMSQSSLRPILQACADNKAWSLAINILKEAQNRQVRFDSSTISAILLVMQRQGSLKDSLALLRSHLIKTTGRDDHKLIPIIFMTAWRHRFYNVCRVLWRYSITLGAVTYTMQNVVTSSLLQNHVISTLGEKEQVPTVANQEWRRRAGKVIVGTDLDTRGFQQLFNLLASTPDITSADPMVWLAQYTSEGEPRNQQLSLAYVMLHRDLEAWKYFARPSTERMIKLLSDAYAMDVRWKSEGVGLERGGKSTQWMIENAIDVSLVRREISLEAVPFYEKRTR